ncbi:hypothetical protein J4219_06580 [Candidatus Woesearchaeota archaeon]|nr:hypothetical protein [Candidatus Woesearchaeota archaeon]
MTEVYDWKAHDKWEQMTRSQELALKDAERKRAYGELTDAINQEKEHKLETILAGATTCIPLYATIAGIPYAHENATNLTLAAIGAATTIALSKYTMLFYQRYVQARQETLSVKDYVERVTREFDKLLRRKEMK